MRLPSAHRPPPNTSPSAPNTPMASYSSEPPSTLLQVPFALTLPLILSSNTIQVIFQEQRSIWEMRFRLSTSLNDGISLPHHQIQAPGSFGLMLENCLHFILLLTINHHGSKRCLLPFKLPRSIEPFQAQNVEYMMDSLVWGEIQFIRH